MMDNNLIHKPKTAGISTENEPGKKNVVRACRVAVGVQFHFYLDFGESLLYGTYFYTFIGAFHFRHLLLMSEDAEVLIF